MTGISSIIDLHDSRFVSTGKILFLVMVFNISYRIVFLDCLNGFILIDIPQLYAPIMGGRNNLFFILRVPTYFIHCLGMFFKVSKLLNGA